MKTLTDQPVSVCFRAPAEKKGSVTVSSPVDTSPVGAVDLAALHPVTQDGAAVVIWLVPGDQHGVGCDVINLWLIRSFRRI